MLRPVIKVALMPILASGVFESGLGCSRPEVAPPVTAIPAPSAIQEPADAPFNAGADLPEPVESAGAGKNESATSPNRNDHLTGDSSPDWIISPDVIEREWTYIVLHHTATDRGSVESIDETHRGRGWLGVGYHFVIGNGNGMGDGEVESTFRWRGQLQGAHAGVHEFNEQGIGIAVIGNFDEAPPSQNQIDAIKALVFELSTTYQISAENVVGHQSVKATACPGKYFPLEEIQSVVSESQETAEVPVRRTVLVGAQRSSSQ